MDVKVGGTLVARVVEVSKCQEGIKFFSNLEELLQTGVMVRPAGYIVDLHSHKGGLHEVLYVIYGKVAVTLKKGRRKHRIFLNIGDMIHLIEGIHGLEFLRDSKVLEVKQGPYDPNAKVFYKVGYYLDMGGDNAKGK